MSQLILIGATPFLTRLFDAPEFGALALFSASYAFAVGLFTLKFDYAIILPESDAVARELTTLCLGLSIVMGLVSVAALAIAKYCFMQALGWYFFLIPVAAMLGVAYTCAQQWAARERDYRRSSQSQVVNAIVNVGVVIGLATTGCVFSGRLVVGYTAGLAGATAFLARGRCLYSGISPLLGLLVRAREFRRFPFYVFPSFLLVTASSNTAPFVLRALFRLEQVGYYGVANRFLLAPSSLVGSAVGEAFRAEFVALQKTGSDTRRLFMKTLRSLLAVAVPAFGLLMLLAPALFEFVLGTSFRQSGLVVRYIGLGVFAQFIAQPFQYVFVATGRVRMGLIVQALVAFAPLFGLIAAGINGYGMLNALLCGAILSTVTSAAMVWMAYRCARGQFITATEVCSHV